jgi:hypothetical protein
VTVLSRRVSLSIEETGIDMAPSRDHSR